MHTFWPLRSESSEGVGWDHLHDDGRRCALWLRTVETGPWKLIAIG